MGALAPGRCILRPMPPAPQEIRTYFITTVTASRRRLFQVERTALLLIEILEAQRKKGNIAIHGFVIMPDHVHLLLTPAHEVSLEKAMQFIKGGFSFRLENKMDVWERSYDSRRIQDANDFNMRLNYIHQNPVRAFKVTAPELFAFSSESPNQMADPIPAHFLS
jgi:putative transposase